MSYGVFGPSEEGQFRRGSVAHGQYTAVRSMGCGNCHLTGARTRAGRDADGL